MYMLMRYSVGVIVEAVVLAQGTNRMRVAAAGFPDTIELRRTGTQWYTATRQPLESDFLMSSTHQGESVSTEAAGGGRPFLVARAAGNNASADTSKLL